MRAIPVPARERILQLYEQGKSTREIAEFFGFCVAAVRRVRQQFKERGSVDPQTHLCGRKTLLTSAREARLQKLVAAQPDATLAEKRWAPPSKTARTWPKSGPIGMSGGREVQPPAWSSWMKAGPTPR
jgi:hypothetical protein